jgi:hypothetical protein
MTGSIFGPPRFIPRTPPGLALGQVAEPITITRELAEAVSEAIRMLVQDPGDPEIYTREACWRDLRSRRWSQVTALQNKITRFLPTQDGEMAVTDPEWSLIESVIECVEAIGSLEQQTTASTLTTVGTLIGVIGGVATLVALL